VLNRSNHRSKSLDLIGKLAQIGGHRDVPVHRQLVGHDDTEAVEVGSLFAGFREQGHNHSEPKLLATDLMIVSSWSARTSRANYGDPASLCRNLICLCNRGEIAQSR
jgi:hypothetical protein